MMFLATLKKPTENTWLQSYPVTFPHRGTSDIVYVVYVVYVYATHWKNDTKGSTRKHQYNDKGLAWDKLEVEENPNYGKYDMAL